MSRSNTLIWLKDFYRRFEAEIGNLYERESFWRTCQNCPDGYCCSHATYIALHRASNPYLYEDWWLMLEYIRDNFSAIEKRQLAGQIKAPGQTCIFLFGNRCGLHPVRSWTSRIYPYTVSFRANSRFFLDSQIELPSCPAMAEHFGLKTGQSCLQTVSPQARDAKSNLVLVKLRKYRPLWVIDASTYVQEYESHIPPEKTIPEWQDLFNLAREAGGEEGELLSYYVENIFR